MGVLDRFRKEEHTHFERDKSGRVTNVYRNGQEGKTSDELIRNYKRENPSRLRSWTSSMKREYRERKYERDMARQQEREAYKRGFEQGRLKRAETMGFQRGMGAQIGPPRMRQVKVRHSHRRAPRKQRPLHFDILTGQWR